MTNRIPKFRVWDRTNKVWTNYFPTVWDMDNRIMQVSQPESYRITDPDEYDRYCFMQFTGLLDRNGKEIYEGDVVKISGIFVDPSVTKKAVVIWVDWNAGFVLQELKKYPGKIETDLDFENLQHADYTLVIGNIYSNPELLKEDK